MQPIGIDVDIESFKRFWRAMRRICSPGHVAILPLCVFTALAAPSSTRAEPAAVTAPAAATNRCADDAKCDEAAIHEQPAAADPAVAPGATQAFPIQTDPRLRYEVTSGDTLDIKFYKHADISGPYVVRLDGTISVPLIGPTQVAKKDALEIEEFLANRFNQVTGRKTYVSVEVSKYRPFFITGFVEKPGSYAWQPGLTVLQAVILAGGFPKSESGSPIASDQEAGHLTMTLDKLGRALVRRERLAAERDGKTEVVAPEGLKSVARDADVREYVAAEQRALAQRMSGLSSNNADFARTIQLATEELAALGEKRSTIRKRIELAKVTLENLQSLAKRGYSSLHRLSEAESTIQAFEGEDREIEILTAQAKQRLSEAERNQRNSEAERKNELEKEFATLDQEIAGYKTTIATSNIVLNRMSAQAGAIDGGALDLKVNYQIVRMTGDRPEILDVDEYAAMRPGDVVKVNRTLFVRTSNRLP